MNTEIRIITKQTNQPLAHNYNKHTRENFLAGHRGRQVFSFLVILMERFWYSIAATSKLTVCFLMRYA